MRVFQRKPEKLAKVESKDYKKIRSLPNAYDRGWYKNKKKKTKGKTQPQKAEVNGQPLLSWVLLARKKLTEGVDEAWAVFDKDEHPVKAEAFEEAGKVIDGKVIHIAFSSRSFEYYLLLHFEYVYHSFNATECGERIDGGFCFCDLNSTEVILIERTATRLEYIFLSDYNY